MSIKAGQSGIKEASIAVVVTRADGTVEDLGEVAYYHKNPLRRWAWELKQRSRAWQPQK